MYMYLIKWLKMAPNGQVVAEEKRENNNKLNGNYTVDTHLKLPKEIGTDYTYKRRVVWFNAIGFLILHLCGFVGLFMCGICHQLTILWSK